MNDLMLYSLSGMALVVIVKMIYNVWKMENNQEFKDE